MIKRRITPRACGFQEDLSNDFDLDSDFSRYQKETAFFQRDFEGITQGQEDFLSDKRSHERREG